MSYSLVQSFRSCDCYDDSDIVYGNDNDAADDDSDDDGVDNSDDGISMI